MAINSIESLQQHLQTAIELEHSTLPPYLCALYSLKDGSNEEARAVLQSVALEEMLHLTLAANILNAVGGTPILDSQRLMPSHPTSLPHSDGSITLSLRPFSREAVEGFMAVERPAPTGSAPEDENYATIGQFYRAIDEALMRLSAELGAAALFRGDPARQVTDALYYGGAGRIIAVTDLDSARRALTEIVTQGEGMDHQSILDGDKDMFHPERDEIAHYFRFEQLLLGRAFRRGDTPSSGPTGDPVGVDWSAVHAMPVNPKSGDYPAGTRTRDGVDCFNSAYCDLLQLLERTFNGLPMLLKYATGAMYGLKQWMIDLMTLDLDGTGPAGPSFEWVSPNERVFPGTQVWVLPRGPYVMRGDIDVFEAEGKLRKHGGVCVLCRCGGSRTKPFCDGTHARIRFEGAETADHGLIADRRKAHPTADGAIVYDDRTRCAHFGQCTDRCPKAFGVSDDNFVDPTAASVDELQGVVSGCPSGALTFAPAGSAAPLEEHQEPSIHPIVDGPYRVRGRIEVIGADGTPYEVRERQTLCRCGQSRNKPFCDGSHWYAEFRDPLPPELADVDPFPWTDPHAAEQGRERYAREQAAKKAAAEPGPIIVPAVRLIQT
jgi:CDGSH-type Zn-finger protein/ferredoxin